MRRRPHTRLPQPGRQRRQDPVPPASVGETSSQEQDFGVSHPAPSYLLLKLSPGWVQSINEGALPLRPRSWTGDCTLGVIRYEYCGPITFPQLMSWWLHARRSKLRLLLSPSPKAQHVKHSAHKAQSHSDRRSPLSPPPDTEPSLRDFALWEDAGHKTDSSQSLPKRTNFICNSP